VSSYHRSHESYSCSVGFSVGKPEDTPKLVQWNHISVSGFKTTGHGQGMSRFSWIISQETRDIVYHDVIQPHLKGTQQVVAQVRNVNRLVDNQDDRFTVYRVIIRERCTDCSQRFRDWLVWVISSDIDRTVKVMDNQRVFAAFPITHVSACESSSDREPLPWSCSAASALTNRITLKLRASHFFLAC